MRAIRARTWFVVADGSRAKVFESTGVDEEPREIHDMGLSIDLPKSGELLADRAGRTFDSVGAGRHAKENPSDPHRHLKREFAGRLVDELRRAKLAERFDRLVLVAPPEFLGDLRRELPKDLKATVSDEIASDLTNTPKQQLYALLKGMSRSALA
jgi:protein required for attachment to host cells